MQVTVLLFGPEREAAGTPRVMVALGGDCRCSTLRHALGEAIPELVPFLASGRLAVNNTFVTDDHELQTGDEVALIGIVGGG